MGLWVNIPWPETRPDVIHLDEKFTLFLKVSVRSTQGVADIAFVSALSTARNRAYLVCDAVLIRVFVDFLLDRTVHVFLASDDALNCHEGQKKDSN